MNVWQLITANSTAGPGATAWQHLNAQKSGEGSGRVIILGGARSVDKPTALTAGIISQELTAHVSHALTVHKLSPALTTNINSNFNVSL
jgi:hypothetical protein